VRRVVGVGGFTFGSGAIAGHIAIRSCGEKVSRGRMRPDGATRICAGALVRWCAGALVRWRPQRARSSLFTIEEAQFGARAARGAKAPPGRIPAFRSGRRSIRMAGPFGGHTGGDRRIVLGTPGRLVGTRTRFHAIFTRTGVCPRPRTRLAPRLHRAGNRGSGEEMDGS